MQGLWGPLGPSPPPSLSHTKLTPPTPRVRGIRCGVRGGWAASPGISELSRAGDTPPGPGTPGSALPRAFTWPHTHLAGWCSGHSPVFRGRWPPPSILGRVWGAGARLHCPGLELCEVTGRRFGKRVFKKRVSSCPRPSSLPPAGCPLGRKHAWASAGVEPISGWERPGSGVSPAEGPFPALRKFFKEAPGLPFFSPNGLPPLRRAPALLKEAWLEAGVHLSLARAPLTCGSESGPLLERLPWNWAGLASKLGGLVSAKQLKT